MGILLSETTDAAGYNPIFMFVVTIVIFIVMMTVMNRSQNKEQKRLNAMLADLQIGDNVLTTSGFYGMVIDISEDSVIVEFGSNKNCRIPMKKNAIAQVEKPGAE